MPSTECASCCLQRTRTRSRNPPSSPNGPRSVQRMPASLPSFCDPERRRAASSALYSPAAMDELPNTHHVGEPTPPQPPTASPAASSDVARSSEPPPIALPPAQPHH